MMLSLVAAVVGLSWWLFPKDLNLSRATTSVINAENGQPAQLWWWKPGESPTTVFHDKESGNRFGEWYSNGAFSWTANKWLKVAKIADRPDKKVKVYLLSQPEAGSDKFYLARRSDLTRVRPLRDSPFADENVD